MCVCAISFSSLKTTKTFILFYFFPEIQISWLVYGWEYGKPTCSGFWTFTINPPVNLVHFPYLLVFLIEQPMHFVVVVGSFPKTKWEHWEVTYIPSSVWSLSFGLQDGDLLLSSYIQSITYWSSIRGQELTNAAGNEWLTVTCVFAMA